MVGEDGKLIMAWDYENNRWIISDESIEVPRNGYTESLLEDHKANAKRRRMSEYAEPVRGMGPRARPDWQDFSDELQEFEESERRRFWRIVRHVVAVWIFIVFFLLGFWTMGWFI